MENSSWNEHRLYVTKALEELKEALETSNEQHKELKDLILHQRLEVEKLKTDLQWHAKVAASVAAVFSYVVGKVL